MNRYAWGRLGLAGVACLALAAAGALAGNARAAPDDSQTAPNARGLGAGIELTPSARLRLAQAQSEAATEATQKAPDAKADGNFRDAEAAFPKFCQEWAAKLHRRETDNLTHVRWREENGYETATYVGYSPIESCACKHSRKGLPVGKLSYHEEIFYLVGHTIEEAKHAKPKIVGTTSTLELFNWNHHQWQY